MVCSIFHYPDTYHSYIFVLKLFSCIFFQKNLVILLDFSPKNSAILGPLSCQSPSPRSKAPSTSSSFHWRCSLPVKPSTFLPFQIRFFLFFLFFFFFLGFLGSICCSIQCVVWFCFILAFVLASCYWVFDFQLILCACLFEFFNIKMDW